jgi:alpha-glutamyl/putrescinyl thymine pyrophosphorylase clade 1
MAASSKLVRSPLGWARKREPRPSSVFETYWRFASERHRIFLRRFDRESPPWTTDPILLMNKFTNAFRASDRVTQYLLARVLREDLSLGDTFFRVLLFKMFNRVSTWELLEREVGPLLATTFNVDRYANVLDAAMLAGRRLYSAAYIMPMAPGFEVDRKHRSHLLLLARLVAAGTADRIAEARSMADAYAELRAYPMMGPFLAYQYVTDLNYSRHMSFSEMEFVVAGPGARDGMGKCFHDLGDFSESDAIRWVADRQEQEIGRLGLPSVTLWGRPLQLIDCQNLFCEVDKYARVAHPLALGPSGRTRIKQRYHVDANPLPYVYPPKWKIPVPDGQRATP